MSHSPEPWHVDTDLPAAIRDENDNAIVWEDYPGSFKTDDLDRIVACVNACREIPTNMLEAVAKGEAEMGYRSPKLKDGLP